MDVNIMFEEGDISTTYGRDGIDGYAERRPFASETLRRVSHRSCLQLSGILTFAIIVRAALLPLYAA